MKQIEKEILFEKGYLVSDEKEDAENHFEVLFSLAALFNIRITAGEKLVQKKMLYFVEKQLGIHVPAPFYQGFPKSVLELSADKLAFDQLVQYERTYGMGWFDQAGHSLFETLLERNAFKEDTPVKDFVIITEAEAKEMIQELVENLLCSSRPLNDQQYAVVLHYARNPQNVISHCASKNTAIRLLSNSHNLQFVSFLSMSDVIALTDEINFRQYQNEKLKKLNLKNQDRKFIAAVMNKLFAENRCDLETCFEKKKLWNGLLHHIHYQPKCDEAAHFVACMRGKGNQSAYSKFEKAIANHDIQTACTILRDEKSPATVLRHLDYLMSRCKNQEDIDFVLKNINSNNTIVLMQLLMRYANESLPQGNRSFLFTKYNKLKVHNETDEEARKRRSQISGWNAFEICKRIRENLCTNLKGRLGKVYIDPAMQKIALPLQENTTQGGYGVLTKGSRLPFEAGKKLRAFTYWEKVNDIDLSVIGLDGKGVQTEFSWRTMANNQSSGITYSGDQTSGYNGGSEYFDIDIAEFRKRHPSLRYLIFCDNVYSGTHFSGCFCKAGFMMRDLEDSGEIFEPKTVQSSFLIDCDSTFAYLFGIDLVQHEFIWLNTTKSGNTTVAGTTSMDFLLRYFTVTSTMNMELFFSLMATERTDNPAEADVIVSDAPTEHPEDAEVIRSCDFEKVLAYLNG